MKTIEHCGQEYPAWQATGNAARFIMPFAKEVCIGAGYDIGCNRPEWAFPGAKTIDPALDPDWHALKLPWQAADYIFSSHCLEHVDDWVAVLDYWQTMLRPGGVLFLYLPHWDQTYWRPWHNRKHRHAFTPDILRGYLADRPFAKSFVSERDLNHSFAAVAWKIA